MAYIRQISTRGLENLRSFPVKSDATFKQGDFVVLTTSGLTGAAAAGSNFATVSSNATRIVGRAMADAINPNDNSVQPYIAVCLAQPGTEFAVPTYAAVAADSIPTISFIGNSYIMRQSEDGFPVINVDVTANAQARITDIDEADAPNWPTSLTGATANATVWIEFLGSASLCTGAR